MSGYDPARGGNWGKEELMSDKDGPKSSSSDFEWPTWHQGQDGGETSRSTTESAASSGTGAGSDPGEPEQGSYAPSDMPPPVIDAFPEQKVHYEPPPEPADDGGTLPWPLTVTIIVASLTAVALIAVLVVIISNGGDSSGPSTAASTTSPSATASLTEAAPPPVTVTSEETQTQTVTVTPTPSSTPTPTYYPRSGSSLQQLQQQVQSDHDVVLRGATSPDRWMPQLGSKKLGTMADEKSYGYDDILADYYKLKQKYPGARLLWSGDWSTFGESDYWVTVANITAPTADEALSWCRINVGPGNNNCYAKLISTTHPVDGSTAYQ
jgi:serine/threonine kinase PknH